MGLGKQIRLFLRITRSHGIARRYFVTNGFDGALTMLGLNMGFYVSGGVKLQVAITACLGAAIALAMSGLTSAYVSESAERKKELRELELAMVRDLGGTAHAKAARFVPILIALVNGLAPFAISLIIISPLWLTLAGTPLPMGPFEWVIGIAFAAIFLIGVFTGRVSGSFWLWSGLRTLLIGLVVAFLIIATGM
jgi:predicted membrane protein (TIGR00267 family)